MTPGAPWPDADAPEEPPLDLDAAWARHRPDLPRARWAALVVRALDGDADAARAAGLTGYPDHDPRHRIQRLRVDAVPSLTNLVRIATDMAPDVGNVAPDRVLGPDGPFLPRPLRLAAVAAACFHPVEGDPHGRSPFRMWCRRAPVPPPADRARLRAIDRQPHRLVLHRDGTAVDLLDGAAFPEVVRHGVAGTGDVWICRIVEGLDGRRYATVGVARPDVPDLDALRAWRRTRLWRARLDTPETTLEDVMRRPAWVRRAWTA